MQLQALCTMNDRLAGTGFMLLASGGQSVLVCNEDGMLLWHAPNAETAWQEIQDCLQATSCPSDTLN